MRIDNFIIWGHGIKHIREIMCILRDNFEIIAIDRVGVKDMAKFVDDIYACDTYPLEHLKAKTRYLMNVPWQVISVTVHNHNVQEREAGSGKFKGVQCDHVVRVKNEIRERFNPSPHHHVIHGTDYESQTDHVLKVMGITGKARVIDGVFDTLASVKIDRLIVRTPEAVRIVDSPHYKYLIGNVEAYENYFFPQMGRRFRQDHFPEAFDLLVKNYDVLPPPLVNRFIVIDGAHRVAIAKFKGIQIIECLTTKPKK